MSNVVLVLNAGSSSLKFSAFRVADSARILHGHVEALGTTADSHRAALTTVLERCRAELGDNHLVAVGHRVVHGGVKYVEPVRVTPEILTDLERLIPLAPLHQPHNLAAIQAAVSTMPGVPQVACFDTAFHRTQPETAQRFALPRRYTDEGVRRYGFHGLSYEYIASVLPTIDPQAAAGRTVVAHLGNGASMCALLAGKSVATTMSFSPADGLVMGTRTGSIDPGVLLYLMARHKMDAATLEHLIYHESGLLGVSGIASDMRQLLASHDPHAAEAIDLFGYRIGRELGSLAAALKGLDALVFTGGIGENASPIRDRIVRDVAWLGDFRVHVIPTNEELMIATHTRRVLGL